jgi:hypothetical protein
MGSAIRDRLGGGKPTRLASPPRKHLRNRTRRATPRAWPQQDGWLRALSPDRDESLLVSMDSLGDGLIATMVFNCCAALVGYRLTGATLLVMD